MRRADLSRLAGAVGGVPERARVALVWDWASWWALAAPNHPSAELDVETRVLDHYRPLWQEGSRGPGGGRRRRSRAAGGGRRRAPALLTPSDRPTTQPRAVHRDQPVRRPRAAAGRGQEPNRHSTRLPHHGLQ
ncbi:beta-galactosidase trimerization domain-containing protein [Streptomyces chisholmiae]|uniref:beta-galactosidase trimerization domain-containing protein n=1 Tax=Streptomyces chisholmiae TaxID=3075540 RepID=UPI00374E1AA0